MNKELRYKRNTKLLMILFWALAILALFAAGNSM